MIYAGRQLAGWRDQLAALVGPAMAVARHRRLRDLWLAPVAMLAVGGLALAFRTRSGHAFEVAYAITRPGDTPYRMLLKLPLSMFAPAALLPFWFALVQVGVVYLVAQSLLGARRTVVVAVVGHALGTLSAHIWVAMGQPVGVAHRYAHVGDAGPSVAVVALLAYLAVVYRLGWLAVGMVAYHTMEIAVFDGLAQREHLVGTLTGVVAALLTRYARRRTARPGGSTSADRARAGGPGGMLGT